MKKGLQSYLKDAKSVKAGELAKGDHFYLNRKTYEFDCIDSKGVVIGHHVNGSIIKVDKDYEVLLLFKHLLLF
jgi:hypothetical protein